MLLPKRKEGREAERVDPPKCRTLSRKKKECFGAQGAKLELLATQTLNQEGGSARHEVLRAGRINVERPLSGETSAPLFI